MTPHLSAAGVAVALALLTGAGASAQAAPGRWIDAGLTWERLPTHAVSGPLPQSFTVPSKAYDYGAASRLIGPALKARPSILRIRAQVSGGQIGIALMSPDGATMVSKETALSPADGQREVFFRLTPKTPPSLVVIRNYDSAGRPGAVTVTGADYLPQRDLTADDLMEVGRAGVN